VVGSRYYSVTGKAAALVRSLGLMKGMTAYIKVHADGTFTVYPNKPPDT
jgi:hypothetical protein